MREEELTPTTKCTGNTYPISLREDEQTSRERNLCVRVSQQTKNRGEIEQTKEECVRVKNGQTWVE